MNKLSNPKILIPLVIVLVVIGAFAMVSMNKGTNDGEVSTPYGHSHGDHGHEH